MDIVWPRDGNDVQVGSYNVIPYIYVYQPGIPEGLIEKLGKNVIWFTRDYLKLSFRRQSAQLHVKENSDKKKAVKKDSPE
jgi:hypothetical protein